VVADQRWELVPLAQWIRGTVRMHFSGGHVATLRMSQADAHEVQLQIDDRLGSLDVTWSRSWIQYKSEDIVLLEWQADPELGWAPLRSDEKRRLAEAGHPHGILASLLHAWRTEGIRNDPRYCITALWTLHHLALSDITSDRWRQLAMSLEGEKGVARLRAVADLPDVDASDELDPDLASPENVAGDSPAPSHEPSQAQTGSESSSPPPAAQASTQVPPDRTSAPRPGHAPANEPDGPNAAEDAIRDPPSDREEGAEDDEGSGDAPRA
jgi:hypothetical protein